MTAKEFLRRARAVDRRVDEATERVDRLRAKLEAGRMSSLTGMPRGGSGDWTQTADRLIELEQRVNARIRELVAERMGLDERQVFRLHGRALQRIEVPEEGR